MPAFRCPDHTSLHALCLANLPPAHTRTALLYFLRSQARLSLSLSLSLSYSSVSRDPAFTHTESLSHTTKQPVIQLLSRIRSLSLSLSLTHTHTRTHTHTHSSQRFLRSRSSLSSSSFAVVCHHVLNAMATESNGNLASSKVETIHLRVYIHCEGCKKKVTKLLTRVEGVQAVEIDASLGKVTVTGTAEIKALIRKLEKKGKVVELWPAPQPLKLPSPVLPKVDIKDGVEDKGVVPKGQHQSPLQVQNSATNGPVKGPKPDTPSLKKTENTPDQQPKQVATKKCDGDGAAAGDQNANQNKVKKSNSGGAGGNESRASPTVSVNKSKATERENGEGKPSNVEASTPSKKSIKIAPPEAGGPDGCNSSKKHLKPDIVGEVENEKTVPPNNSNPSGASDAEKAGNGSNKKKRGGGAGGNNGQASNDEENEIENELPPTLEPCDEDIFVESASNSTSNKHIAPPPMVLVETSDYSPDIEYVENATHMFSDENANNCTLM
ncbi:hypothetical protein KP509_04G056300 [Ceratopteris richardii]|uniref:HMA domain-containing protein n=1 Tax=Ceratopteris richardii TaxID=49495 RepID=A0A8T2UT42_CERRI|nr:hypothetical protein KP509_04G056300 [Ceratopteris richardii]